MKLLNIFYYIVKIILYKEISGNFIRSDLIWVSCVVVSCFHRTCETVLWVPHLLQHRQDLKSWPLCDVLSVWILPSGRRYDKRCGTQKTVSQVRWKQDTTTQETRIRSGLMKLPELSFTWLDIFDRNTSNCFVTDSNDQLKNIWN
jgi:hypothetical protein